MVKKFLDTREAGPLGIPPKLAAYILQLNEASNLHRRHHSITVCAKKLQESYPKLSISACTSRIYDAINYLNNECSVTSEAWMLYYADMLMKLFEVNLTAQNFREARVCLVKSCEYRINASAHAIDPDRIRFKPQIVSPDVELQRMGIKPGGLFASYKKALSLIGSLDTNETEKQRLIREVEKELNITDIPHEEFGK